MRKKHEKRKSINSRRATGQENKAGSREISNCVGSNQFPSRPRAESSLPYGFDVPPLIPHGKVMLMVMLSRFTENKIMHVSAKTLAVFNQLITQLIKEQ